MGGFLRTALGPAQASSPLLSSSEKLPKSCQVLGMEDVLPLVLSLSC